MNEGYKQASEISRTLILMFIFGIVIGSVIGWGARATWNPGGTPPENVVALETAPAEAPTPPPPAPVEPPEPELPSSPVTTPTAEPEIAPASNSLPEDNGAPFNPDVDGLWPAAHLFTGIQGTKADVETLEWLNEFKPGGVVLGPENVTDGLQLSALILQIKQAVGLGTKITDPPFIIFEDPEHALPRLLPLEGDGSESGNSPDAAAAQAREALKLGVGVFLGPSLEIFTPGLSEARLESVSLGNSADAVSGLGLSYASQLAAAGLIAVTREFPGAGLVVKTEADVWQIPADQMDALATAMEPFKAAMDAGVPGMVVGNMAVPGIDLDRPNRPASLSPRLIQLLVRQDWHFNGVLIASDITRHPMTRALPRDEIALKSLYNGCDAVILKDANSATLRTICATFVRLSARSEFPADQFAASRQRLRDWLSRLGTPVITPTPSPLIATALPEPPQVPAAAPVAAGDAPKPQEPPTPAEVPVEVPAVVAPEPVPVPETTTDVVPTPEIVPEPEKAPEPVTTPEPEKAPEPVTTPEAQKAPEPTAEPAATPEVVNDTAAMPREHTIVKGDSLIALAKRYHVSVADLRTWNGMDNDVVKIGQVLKIQDPKIDKPESKPEEGVKEAEAKPEKELKPVTEAVKEEPKIEASNPTDESTGSTPPSAESSDPEPTPTAPVVVVPDPPAAARPAEEKSATQDAAVVPQPEGTDKRNHLVASGETLGAIAGMYGVSVAEIQAWNGLDPGETVINAGASLVLYLAVAVQEEKVSTTEAKPDDAKPNEPVPVEKAAHTEPAPGTFEIYEVAQGDNLRRIAQRFGTTQQKLIEMNHIESPDLVKIGWKLKVPKQTEIPVSGSTP